MLDTDHMTDYAPPPICRCGDVGFTELLLLETPPLYLSTVALIADDALGNLDLLIPPSAALAAAIFSAALFLLKCRTLGMVVALLGLMAAATYR
jgi:hypothetical protein